MKKYTVLLRPDWIADPYGQDTYLAHVEARDVQEAQETAQREAYQTNNSPSDDSYDLDEAADYFVLAVFEGHLNDLKEDS